MQQLKMKVFIGRFSPFHKGHAEIIQAAVKSDIQKLVVLIGSSGGCRTTKNPFTFDERAEMIKTWFTEQCLNPEGVQLVIHPVRDYPYNNNKWFQQVQSLVQSEVSSLNHRATIFPGLYLQASNKHISLIGCNKDESTWYLDSFPMYNKEIWDPANQNDSKHDFSLSATRVREIIFTSGAISYYELKKFVPSTTWKIIHRMMDDDGVLSEVIKDYYHELALKLRWNDSPYAPVFSTVDAVVVHSGHILLIRRKSSPGENLLALPGGYVNQKETLKAACIRELKEETKLKIPEKVLEGSIKDQQIFDAPDRSQRGRIITTAFLIRLSETGELPKVKGGDDAAQAFWVPLSEVAQKYDQFFEDHFHIIETMISGNV